MNGKIEKALEALKTNQNMYMAWDKAKQYGKLRWMAFGLFSMVPAGKLLCGRGWDYIGKLKNHGCVLQLEGTGAGENTRFYLPNFEKDAIQRLMVYTKNFYERFELQNLKENYIRKGDVCLDIGANIGNHSVYFAKMCHASKVYAFEPVKSTYAILQKNISLNDLENRIEACNIGISDRTKSARIAHFEESNIGGTQLAEDQDGDLRLTSLDDIQFRHNIDFVKIDIEGMEYDLLRGARRFFEKNRPVVFIEISKKTFSKVDALLQQYGYRIYEKREGNMMSADNYIYRYV